MSFNKILHELEQAFGVALYLTTDSCEDSPSFSQFQQLTGYMRKQAVGLQTRIGYTISQEYILGGWVETQQGTIYIGPTLAGQCTRHQAERLLHALGVSIEYSNQLITWFHQYSPCNIGRLRSIITVIDKAFNDTDYSVPEYLPFHKTTPFQKHSFEKMGREITTLLELEILTAVRHGDCEKVEAFLSDLKTPKDNVALFSHDLVRSYKNNMIMTISLLYTEAIRGGIDIETALQLRDHYLFQVEDYVSYSEINAFFRTMMLDFTNRVAIATAVTQHSYFATKVSKYIQSHIQEPIHLDQLAEDLGLSKGYLCRRFKAETGMTIIEFSNQYKISLAKMMLLNQDMSLIEISDALGFCSQNYFHKIFKRYATVTPQRFIINSLHSS